MGQALPRTLQSGARTRPGRTGKGNPYLKGVLGDAAAAAGKTDTFLRERYRWLVGRRGKLKALVAIARTILVIIWHLLADSAARYSDLGEENNPAPFCGWCGPTLTPATKWPLPNRSRI
jgi:transposase